MLCADEGGQVVDGDRRSALRAPATAVAVAVVLVMTVKEPPRGYSDPPTKTAYKRATWAETFAAMYPRGDEWRKIRDTVDPDGVFASDMSRRLALTS